MTFFEQTMEFAGSWRVRAGRPKVATLAARGDVDGLLRLAGRAGGRIRAAAESRLAAMDPREAAAAVRAAVGDPSDRIRCAAVRTLFEWGDAMSLAEAVFWLPPSGAARGLAMAGLAELGEPLSAPVLAGSLVAGTAQEDLWEDEVELVLSLCRPSPGGAALSQVLEVLAEAHGVGDEGIARRAEDFLVWLEEAAVPTATALARSGPAPDRAVWVLGQIGGPSVADPLIEAVDHPDARAREAACVALGELRDPISVEALIRAAHDTEHGVRVAAAAALRSIGVSALVAGMSAGLAPRIEAESSRPRLTSARENGSAAQGYRAPVVRRE